MAISVAWTDIVDGQVDADSPLNQLLFQSIKGNLYHLENWLGKNYTADDDHDHDGTNSKAVIVPDGSISEAKLASSAVSQAKLKISSWSDSTTSESGSLQVVTGGAYGFYPQLKVNSGYVSWGYDDSSNVGTYSARTGSTSYVCSIQWSVSTGGSTGYAKINYITSSGEVFWLFIQRYKDTKKIISMSQAPDHPCFGNGGDPEIVPHPFLDYDPAIHEIMVINPDAAQVLAIRKRAKALQCDFLEIVNNEYEIDETSRPAWPKEKVTVGLDEDLDSGGLSVVKKQIPKPDYVLCRSLKKKTPQP